MYSRVINIYFAKFSSSNVVPTHCPMKSTRNKNVLGVPVLSQYNTKLGSAFLLFIDSVNMK